MGNSATLVTQRRSSGEILATTRAGADGTDECCRLNVAANAYVLGYHPADWVGFSQRPPLLPGLDGPRVALPRGKADLGPPKLDVPASDSPRAALGKDITKRLLDATSSQDILNRLFAIESIAPERFIIESSFKPGFEERLLPMLQAFKQARPHHSPHVLLIDFGITDATVQVARRYAAEQGFTLYEVKSTLPPLKKVGPTKAFTEEELFRYKSIPLETFAQRREAELCAPLVFISGLSSDTPTRQKLDTVVVTPARVSVYPRLKESQDLVATDAPSVEAAPIQKPDCGIQVPDVIAHAERAAEAQIRVLDALEVGQMGYVLKDGCRRCEDFKTQLGAAPAAVQARFALRYVASAEPEGAEAQALAESLSSTFPIIFRRTKTGLEILDPKVALEPGSPRLGQA